MPTARTATTTDPRPEVGFCEGLILNQMVHKSDALI
jgi:hypothetical protein